MNPLEQLHARVIFRRRVDVLANLIAPLIPHGASVLDVGCGGGEVAQAIARLRPDLQITGLEVQPRPTCLIPVVEFDGRKIAEPDGSVDIVYMTDVLHHTSSCWELLREARRVARKAVILKDHLREGLLARGTLRFMDRVGNARHGIPLPYAYWSCAEWRDAFRHLDLRPVFWQNSLKLYPWPASLAFDRSLHFLAKLVAAEV